MTKTNFVEEGLNIELTKEEQKLFELEEHKLFYSLSGGHNCGDFANITITDFDEGIDGDDKILMFDFEVGNYEDKYKEWGNGRFNRNTKKFEYD